MAKFGIEKKPFDILKELAERKYPTLFSFKGNTILEDKYLQLFDDYKHNNFQLLYHDILLEFHFHT